MAKTVYVSALGNDANDGLTPVTARRRPNAGYDLCVDGDTLLIERGMYYEPRNGFFLVVRRSNFIIDAYGSGEPPCFDSRVWEGVAATGWTHEGSGVWSKTIGATNNRGSRVNRVWVGATNNGVLQGQRTDGTAYRRAKGATDLSQNLATLIGTLNANDIWRHGGPQLGWNKLYVWTGSTTVAPPQFYNGLAFNVADGSTTGAYYAVQIQNCQNSQINNIWSWGSATFSFRMTSSTTDTIACRNNSFNDCRASGMYSGAFDGRPGGAGSTDPRIPVTGGRVRRMLCNAVTNPTEQEPEELYGNLAGAMDMLSWYDSVDDCWGENCTVINSFHVAFVVGAYTSNDQNSNNSGWRNSYSYCDTWHSYSRGLSTNPSTNSCGIIDCYFDGQSVRSQLSGEALVDGCTWVNMKVAPRKAGVSGWIVMGAEILDRGYTNIGNARYFYVVSSRVRVRNCLVVDPVGTPVIMETFDAYNFPNVETGSGTIPEPTIPAGAIELSNNIIYDRVRGTAPWLRSVTRSSTPGAQNFSRNWVFKGDGQPTATAEFLGAIVAINAGPGCFSNQSTDPKIDITNLAAVRMALDSPCRRAGVFNGIGLLGGRRSASPPSAGPLRLSIGPINLTI